MGPLRNGLRVAPLDVEGGAERHEDRSLTGAWELEIPCCSQKRNEFRSTPRGSLGTRKFRAVARNEMNSVLRDGGLPTPELGNLERACLGTVALARDLDAEAAIKIMRGDRVNVAFAGPEPAPIGERQWLSRL